MPLAAVASGMDHGNPTFLRDPAAPTPGGRRLGSIELQDVLSHTGHAVVYRAWDHGLGRPAVVEEFFPAALARRTADGRVRPADPSAAERFEQGRAWFVGAWRVLAQCDHPSLVRVLLLLEAHGTAYAVMPAQPGEPLATQTGLFPLDEPALLGLIDDLLGALETYHRSGCAHGDLRPATVRWQPGGRALLVSPGAARPVDAGSAAAALAADLQALALLARFCVTGVETPAMPPGAAEPLAASIERLGFDAAVARYNAGLAWLLRTAAEPDASRRPDTPEQWRVLLADAAPPRPLFTAPPAASPPPVPPPPMSPPPVAPPPMSSPPVAPPAVSPPVVPAAAEAAEANQADLTAFDPQTAAHIQRVLESFAETGDGPRHARRPAPLGGADTAPRVAPAYEPLPEPGPRRWPVWLGLAAVALVFGVGAWQVDYSPPEGVRIAGSPPPATAPIAEAAPAEPAASPAVTLPAPVAETPAPAPVPDFTEAAPAAPPPVAERLPPAPPAAAPPPAPTPPPRARTAAPATPRAQCGERTQFSLYRCMQQACSTARWRAHPQCARLRETDTVD
jgi:serine/threonine protein kinase